MADNETVYRITVDTQGAVKNVKDLQDAEKDLHKTTEDVGEGFTEAERKIITLNNGLELGAKAGQLASRAFGTLTEALGRGDVYNDVAAGFQEMAEKSGLLSNTLLGDLKKATAGTITDFNLMKLANDAATAGLDPEAFVKVTTAAKKYGDTLGKDTSQAIQELSNGLQTGRVNILKQYGVFLDSTEVVKEYAKAHGVAAEQVTEAGKVAAIQEAALKQLGQTTGEAGEEAKGGGDSFDSLKVSIENALDKVAGMIDSNPELAKTFQDIADTIDSIDIEGLANEAAGYIQAIAKFATEAIKILDELSKAITGTDQQFNTGWQTIKKMVTEFKSFDTAAKEVMEAQQSLAKATVEQTNELKKGAKAADEMFGSLDVASKGEKGYEDALKATNTALNRKVETEKAVKAGLIDTTIQTDKAKKAGEEHAKKLKEQADLYKKLQGTEGIKEYSSKLADLYKLQQDGLIDTDTLITKTGELRKEWVGGGGDLKVWNTIADVANGNLEEMQNELDKTGKEADKFSDRLTEGVAEAIQGLGQALVDGKFSEGLTSVVGNIGSLFGNQLGTVFAQSLGGTLGSFGGPIGAALGSIIGSSIVDHLNSSVTDALKNKNFDSLGRDIDTIFPGLGSIGASIAGSLFGSDSEEETARKAADKYFADLFDANRVGVVIGGQMQQIKDLVFSGNQEGGGIFSTLSSDAQSAFDGIGLGFQTLLGIGTDVSLGLGSVFANNFGGSLNNIQVMLMQTGVSAEQLKTSVINSFKQQNLTFMEAASALDAIQKITEKGIPDGIGLTVEAFQNFQAASTKGGAYAIDALQDIGAEAQELHITTLPALMDQLVNSGKVDAQAVRQLFTVLGQYGISSIEGIRDVGEETAIRIGAALEAQNFPFAETQDNISDLRAELDKIPRNIERNLKFKVSVDASQSDRELISKGRVDIPGAPPGLR